MDPQHDRRGVVRCRWHHELREQDMVDSHQLGDHSPFRIPLLSSLLFFSTGPASSDGATAA